MKPVTQSLGGSSAQPHSSRGTTSQVAQPSPPVGGVPEWMSATLPPEFELSPSFSPAWRSTAPKLASDPEPVAPAAQKTVGRIPPAVLATPLPATQNSITKLSKCFKLHTMHFTCSWPQGPDIFFSPFHSTHQKYGWLARLLQARPHEEKGWIMWHKSCVPHFISYSAVQPRCSMTDLKMDSQNIFFC